MEQALPPWTYFRLDGALISRLARRFGVRRLAPAARAALGAVGTWLPTALLCAFAGTASWDGFLRDLPVHARLLIAIPSLIYLDRILSDLLRDNFRRMALLMRDEQQAAYGRLSANISRRLNSPIAELIVLAITVTLVWIAGTGGFSDSPERWELLPSGRHSAAGLFHQFVALPLIIFLSVRWIYRYLLWLAFIARSSRYPLSLVTTHPDHAGGLAFVGRTQLWFACFVIALELIAAAKWAALVKWHGASLQQFVIPLVVAIVCIGALFIPPVLVFSPALWRLRYAELTRFDIFSAARMRAFELRWIDRERPRPPDEESGIVERGDISALTDLQTSFDAVHSLQLLPLSRRQLLQFVACVVAPALLPVASTLPLSEILKTLVGAVF